MAASIRKMIGKSSMTMIQDVGFLVKHNMSPLYNVTPVMYMRGKHYDQKFRKDRMYKTIFIDKQKIFETRSESALHDREKRKLDEVKKSRKSMTIDNEYDTRKPTGIEMQQIADPYVPPEGDGKHSILNKDGLLESAEYVKKKAVARLQAIRRIRKHEHFNVKEVAPELLKIYIDAHELLTNFRRNDHLFADFTTMLCKEKMTFNLAKMTVRWEFIENIEPPKVVHVTCSEGYVKDVYHAQVTLRLHTKQIFALYDQFGRLIYGDPKIPRDSLEFIVFEKNIVDLYGRWKMADKIKPSWLPQTFKHQTFYDTNWFRDDKTIASRKKALGE